MVQQVKIINSAEPAGGDGDSDAILLQQLHDPILETDQFGFDLKLARTVAPRAKRLFSISASHAEKREKQSEYRQAAKVSTHRIVLCCFVPGFGDQYPTRNNTAGLSLRPWRM